MTSVIGGRRRAVAFRPERVVPAPRAVKRLFARSIPSGDGFVRPDGAAPVERPLGGSIKRGVDLALCILLLVVLSPLMLIVAGLIRVSLGGPVIFAHRRVGYGGKSFDCYKFRSMVNNADEVLQRHLAANADAAREWRETRKLVNDPRVSCLGNVLRKSSLDELPQLFNVLRGDMSLVGPRPIVPDEVANYGRHYGAYQSTRPGMTGLWQTSGRNRLTYRARVARDTYYVRNWSLRLDLLVMLKTLPAILSFDDTA